MEHNKIDWYALSVRRRYEKVVARNLSRLDHEVFLPILKTSRQWSDRIKELELPLFPGYVLSRFDPNNRSQIMMTPGVNHIVCFGGQPCPIPEGEVESIRSVLNSSLEYEPWPFIPVGQRVRVQRGALTGLEGPIVEYRNSHRLIVSLSLLRCAVSVTVERDWIAPVTLSPMFPSTDLRAVSEVLSS